MSWNPFSRHATPRRNVVPQTVERDFQREVKRLERLEQTSRRIYKDVKKSAEANNAFSKIESKLARDLANSSYCKSETDFKSVISEWNEAVVQLEKHIQEMNTTNQKAVVEPMKKFTTVFPGVQGAVKRRDQSLLEFQRCQAKMEKYQDRERTGQNIVKLENSKKTLAKAKDDFCQQHCLLMEDMPSLYEGRIAYFQPSFQALIKSQLLYYAEAKKIYTEVSEQLNPMNSQDDLYHDKQVEKKLAEIKALSIVADD